jgi:hypothetical protein
MNGGIDLDTDTIKIALVTNSYTPNRDTDDNWDDVVTYEVGNSGTYSVGGATLGSVTVTADNTDDEGVFDAADVSWTATTITAKGAVIYKSTGTNSTSKLICYLDFGTDKSTSNGTFQITFNSEGILNLS